MAHNVLGLGALVGLEEQMLKLAQMLNRNRSAPLLAIPC